MNIQRKKIVINSEKFKYQFMYSHNDTLITYRDFINKLKDKDRDFWREFKVTFGESNSEFGAYFWECSSVSKNTLDKPFEFVTIKSKALSNITQDYSSFSKYFRVKSNKKVVSFDNLGKDAFLIVPVPVPERQTWQDKDYKNLSQFTKNAPEEQ